MTHSQSSASNDTQDENSIRDLLIIARDRIRAALADAPPGSADSAYLDALVLLSETTGWPKERILADLREPLEPTLVRGFESLVDRRCAGEPVSYILGRKEFFGRIFSVGPEVLVPRPETEHLVELALALADHGLPPEGTDASQSDQRHIHDACSGSGCVAVSIAAERPKLLVSASDLSLDALRIARKNRDRILGDHPLPIWQSNGLEALSVEQSRRGLPAPFIVTANPPYLTDNEYNALRSRRWPEPQMALAAGPDGLDLVRKLSLQGFQALASGGWMLLEIGATQGPAAIDLLSSAGFQETVVHSDLAGLDRVVVGRKPA